MSTEIRIKKESVWKYSTFILVALLVVMSFLYFTKEGSTSTVKTQEGAKISLDNDAVLGNKNAKVTIVEFSDYQCPFCARFWSSAYQQIKTQYIDTGKVKLVFRDFPLNFHPFAQKSAEATECVREKGGDEAYFEMHDKIFSNQEQLSESNLKAWAKELGYDIETCLNTGKYASEVSKDLADGQAYGVTGTPAFFVNGQKIVGAQPFEAFKQIIDAELAK